MTRMVVRRVLALPLIFLLVCTFSFALIHLVPGDPAVTIAGDTATPEQLAAIRHQLGLDAPWIEQYGTYLWNTVRLHLGTSFATDTSVGSRIGETIRTTASLGLVAVVLGVVFAVPAGIVAAYRRQRPADRTITAVAALGLAVPPFVIGLALVVLVAVNRPWFPASGYVELGVSPAQWLWHLFLPGLALCAVLAAELVRQIRSSVAEVTEQDFIRSVRAKGIPGAVILLKHVFRNSAVPVLTVFGLQIGRLLGSAVVIEQIFAIPGLGSLAYSSVVAHDYPVVQGIVLVSAVIVVFINLLVDVLNAWINPRLRTAV